jgi:plastocyanin
MSLSSQDAPGQVHCFHVRFMSAREDTDGVIRFSASCACSVIRRLRRNAVDGDAVWAFALNGTVDQLPSPPPVSKKVETDGRIVKIGDTWATPGNQFDDRVFDGSLNMEDHRFFLNRVQVPAGTTVTWNNVGAVIHTATDTKGSFDTGDVAGGGSTSVTFDSPGTYTYSCLPHPWMIGQVLAQ